MAEENQGKLGTKIIPRIIQDEMKQSYLDYSMSVIVGRALPNVRDGLKPVHRRVLFTMWESGLLHNSPFKKSANVVGNCMAKFHPHGDSAIYDTLVRLAQDFSMRYQLIDGQGNFGCFTADTKVKLTDGRDLTFTELIREYEQGKRNFTFTVNEKGSIQIAEIKNPRMTKKNAEIMKVILDNGEEIKCTLNHKFMLKDGSYKESKDLMPEDSLMPAYFRISAKSDNPNVAGYSMVFQPRQGLWNFVHVLADEWNISNEVYAKSAGRIRHHADFNKINNNPDNIRRIGWKEHWKTHYELTSQKHKTDNEYVKKLAQGRKEYWSNPENRKKHSKITSFRNIKNWKNDKYREQMRITLSNINKKYLKEHPEIIEKISQRASATLKRLWKIPEYKELFHNKIVASNKRRLTNLTGKKKFLKICAYLKENNLSFDKENYEKVRREIFGVKSFTSWDLGIKKYYSDNKNLVICEINGNHKVSKIELLKEFADVYDLAIDNTHNFALSAGIFVHNSVDGDPPAAMRYTECRLKKLAEEMLEDIDKKTVKFIPNFDTSTTEPTVLPSKLPNLLINGSSGIAVGMATNMPPHNISEVIDAVIRQIDNPDLSIEELMSIVHGPDFPTGALICGKSGIKDAYSTGRGKILVRARTKVEDDKGRQTIIVNEIPFMVNKSELVEEIAELVRDKKIIGISDLRDESDRDGIRVVIELKKDTDSGVVLNQLFQHTRMQTTFGIIMLALVNNEPKVLNIKQLIHYYIAHRKDVVRRRALFELNKAQIRAHILEGLMVALANIDEIIKQIKESKSIETAKQALESGFNLTNEQAVAILEMRLSRLTSLEQEKIKQEHSDLMRLIEDLESILSSPQKILGIIKKELIELKEKYGDARRTEIVDSQGTDIETEDMIKDEEMAITITNSGYIKRLPLETYKIQRRGGKGVIAAATKDEDIVKDIFIASTHSYILFFTNKGRVHWLKVYALPEASRQARGKAIVNLLELGSGESVTAFVPIKEFDDKHCLIMATKKGTVKKTILMAYGKPRRGGIAAITLEEGDELINVQLTDGNQQIMLATKNGNAVRFEEKNVRSTGRSAQGVRGISLKENDTVIGMVVASGEKTLMSITENGYGKRTPISDYRIINRGGSGVISIQCSERNGKVVSICNVTDNDDLIFISKKGIVIRVPASDISVIGRNTQGVRIMKLEDKDRIVSAVKVAKESNGN